MIESVKSNIESKLSYDSNVKCCLMNRLPLTKDSEKNKNKNETIPIVINSVCWK